MRIGIGFDVHRLVEGRKLILGGVDIPCARGLLGHSDGDVLCHALTDALLGAAGLPDIGVHFPDTDPKLKGISSLVILKEAVKLIRERQLIVNNIDATIVLQTPRIQKYIDMMKSNIAEILGIAASAIGMKAKTTEGLGFTGRGEGVAVYAVACLSEADRGLSEADRGLSEADRGLSETDRSSEQK
jgi:2-C-methyl-D-erythritol 2,4-cyclodiphosphate synthase